MSRLRLPPARRRRRRLPTPEAKQRFEDLVRRTGVERPQVLWAGDVRDATTRLEQNLTHQTQPSLFDGGVS